MLEGGGTQTHLGVCLPVLLVKSQHHSAYEVIGHRLIQRELQVTLLASVGEQCLIKGLVSLDWGEDADVLLVGREVDECVVEFEGRHLIANGLLRRWYRLPDEGSELPKDCPTLGRDGG